MNELHADLTNENVEEIKKSKKKFRLVWNSPTSLDLSKSLIPYNSKSVPSIPTGFIKGTSDNSIITNKLDMSSSKAYAGQNLLYKSFDIDVTDITENNKHQKVQQFAKALRAVYAQTPCTVQHASVEGKSKVQSLKYGSSYFCLKKYKKRRCNMQLVIRRDVYERLCKSLGFEIKKSHKYIRRWEKKNGTGWEYEYPSDMPKNTTKKKARKHIAKKTKVITGVKLIQNEEDYKKEINRLTQLSRKGQLKCKALGNENIVINSFTSKYSKTTKGTERTPKETYHKWLLFSFTEKILKNGVLNEVTRRNTKDNKRVIYRIVNMCRYYDKHLHKIVDVPIEVAIGYDENKKKYVLSVADF